jgi:Tol biopolymer transport system component
MPGRVHHLVAVGIVAMIALGATAGAAPAPTGGEESIPPPVGRVAAELARSGARSVMVFVSDGGKEYVATAGARRPAAEQRFRVGSVTKTFTATIVLQLVQEGALRLDSTLHDHLPGVVPRGDEITLRHLLSHRSGLVNITDYPSWLEPALRSPSTRPIDTLRFASSKPLTFNPGSPGRYPSYSNTNYIALGLVIEKVTGHSYAQELEQRILEPLGLDRTELPRTPRLPDLADGGYNPNVPWAAGAIVSNARDLSRFYSALLSGRILSSASLSTMKKTVGGVALGIFPTPVACGRSWGHLGAIIDYVTLVSAHERDDRVAVVSVRSGPPFLPPVESLLLCPEGESVAGPAQDGRKLAFISSPRFGPGLLYVVGADGSGQRWLTLTASGIPAWSPDGRRVAFESVGDVNPALFVVNADGSGRRRLTRSYGRDFSPAWSPNGRKIAFLSNRGGDAEIYVINTDGSRPRNLTRNPAPDSVLAWSPDGRRIAFLSKRDGNWQVYVMTADGSGQRRLTRGDADASSPVWSPDGRKIAYTSTRNGNFEVFVMNADGSAHRNLTRNAGRDLAPAWSPDGRRIAFGSVRNGKPGVYVVNADGSGHRRLTQHGEQPLWSPDGRSIAFRSRRDGNPEIYVMNADGSGQRNLTRSPAREDQFAWAPRQSK